MIWEKSTINCDDRQDMSKQSDNRRASMSSTDLPSNDWPEAGMINDVLAEIVDAF